MSIVVITAGFILDILFGDPLGFIHPVRGIGLVITAYEKLFFKKKGRLDILKGVFLVVVVVGITFGITFGIIYLARLVHPVFGTICEIAICWSVLSAHGLKKESMKVYHALSDNDKNLEPARKAVSMIVGRDTTSLDRKSIIKAAVETVAENSSDGEIAPLFYLAVGGPVLGMCYKAVNTMDSMVGYKNERYLYFGRAAAKLDDIAGFIPSRIAAIVSVAAAFFLKYDARGAWHTFCRDRNKTESPNAGQTESVYAGALGIALGGDAIYFGKVVQKPVLGTENRPVQDSDIVKANRLMYACSYICLLIFGLIRLGVTMYL